jgi:hypothetical protein
LQDPRKIPTRVSVSSDAGVPSTAVTQPDGVRMSEAKRLRGAFKDVALALHCDRERGIHFGDIDHRFHAALDARGAMHDREQGARSSYRQALIELAAACIRVAADYREPAWGSSISAGDDAAIRRQVPSDPAA